MKCSFFIIIGILFIITPIFCLELIVNGAFEDPLSNGWTTIINSTNYTLARWTGYDPDPDYEVKVTQYTGTGYIRVFQVVQIPSTDLDFSAKLKLYAYSFYSSWTGAALILAYYDESGILLGETFICDTSINCPWTNTPTRHLIVPSDSSWYPYSFNITSEISSNLPGVNGEDVKQIKVSLYTEIYHNSTLDEQAEVIADDISIDFVSAVPVVLYDGHNIDDSGGNGNGYMDPGETVNIATRLKNYGTAATDVNGTLTCGDPYITIHDGTSDFGDIASGDTTSNASDPFSVEAAAGAPEGHIVDFAFVADAQGGTSDTSYFSLCIGKFHYFVWDPTPDMSSGPEIDNALKDAGYGGVLSQMLPIASLNSYSAIFVSVGVYANNYIIDSVAPEGNVLANFVTSGGRMYLEGGDVWYYDPPNMKGYDFGPLFGVNATSNGSGDLSTVQGWYGTFTNAMYFNYNGENSYIDHISPTGSGFLIFRNMNPVYDCGVANDAGTYRTVGCSFEFGALVDGAAPSTKAVLADSIMRFFGLGLGTQDEPIADKYPNTYRLSKTKPNPFAQKATFSYAIPRGGAANIKLFDASGRMVRWIAKDVRTAGYHLVQIDAKDLQAGIYFIKLSAGRITVSRKCIVVK